MYVHIQNHAVVEAKHESVQLYKFRLNVVYIHLFLLRACNLTRLRSDYTCLCLAYIHYNMILVVNVHLFVVFACDRSVNINS